MKMQLTYVEGMIEEDRQLEQSSTTDPNMQIDDADDSSEGSSQSHAEERIILMLMDQMSIAVKTMEDIRKAMQPEVSKQMQIRLESLALLDMMDLDPGSTDPTGEMTADLGRRLKETTQRTMLRLYRFRRVNDIFKWLEARFWQEVDRSEELA